MRRTIVSTVLIVLLMAWCCPAGAQETGDRDMEFYLEHCKSCHGEDAAAFAKRKLQLAGDATIQTRTKKPLAEFLSTHGAADERDRRELLVMFEKLMRAGGR